MNWLQFALGFIGLIGVVGGSSVVIMSKVRKVADDANVRLVEIYKDELALLRKQWDDDKIETSKEIKSLREEIVRLEHIIIAMQESNNKETALHVVDEIAKLWNPETFADSVVKKLETREAG